MAVGDEASSRAQAQADKDFQNILSTRESVLTPPRDAARADEETGRLRLRYAYLSDVRFTLFRKIQFFPVLDRARRVGGGTEADFRRCGLGVDWA